MPRPDNRKIGHNAHRRNSQISARMDASRTIASRETAEKKSDPQDRAIYRALGLLDEGARRPS